MKVLGNSNCIMHIISNMLRLQNPKLLDHGSRVGYLTAKMLEIKGCSAKEVVEGYVLGVLHDVGAYKTEEIDKLTRFETEYVFEHTIYGYLILKLSEIMEDKIDAILYHHTPWKQLERIRTENAELANMIFLADRVEIYLRNNHRSIDRDVLEKMDCFAAKNIELFCKADEICCLQKRVLDGSYINATERYLYRADFSKEELRKLIRMAAILIDFRSESTVTHTITMVSAAIALANIQNLDKQQLDEIYMGAYVHDLGKVAIPTEILEKPGKLTEDEMEVMKTHIILTGKIINGHVSSTVYKIAMRHHEKLDGNGYPYGIKEEEMSMAEKIVAVADIYSALTRKRSYKESFPKEKVIAIMNQMAEQRQISKEVVQILVCNYEKIERQVEEECREIIHNYEEIKEEYKKLHKIIMM